MTGRRSISQTVTPHPTWTMSWKQIESDALEVEASKSVCQKLDKGTGEVILTSYAWKGIAGDLDGLVIGDLDGEPVYVIVEAKYNLDFNRPKALNQLDNIAEYIDNQLLRDTTVVDDEEAYSEDSAAIQVDRLRGRTRYWAFGGVQCKHPEKLLVKTKRCIIVLLSN